MYMALSFSRTAAYEKLHPRLDLRTKFDLEGTQCIRSHVSKAEEETVTHWALFELEGEVVQIVHGCEGNCRWTIA